MPDANPNLTTPPRLTLHTEPTREAVQRLLTAAAGDAPEWSPTGLARGWTAAVAAYIEDDGAGDAQLRTNKLSDAQMTQLNLLGETGSRHTGDIAAKLAVVVLETALDSRAGDAASAIHRITASALADVVLLGDRPLPSFASVAVESHTAALPAPEPTSKPEDAARHPDAVLLAACASFDTLERHYVAGFSGKGMTHDEEEARSDALQPIQNAQEPLVDIIAATPAKTLEGIRAKAASLSLWDAGEIEKDGGPDGDTNERLLASLMRDLLRCDVLPAPPQAAPLVDLARQIAAVQHQRADFDDMAIAAGGGERDTADDALTACVDQEIALRQLILRSSAAGLPDATAQVHTALMQVTIARECEETREMLADVLRGLRSALAVLASAAGVDVADFGESPHEPKAAQ